MATVTRLSWVEFKTQASSDIEQAGAFVFRGQRDPAWQLISSVHRTSIVQTINDIPGYVNWVLPTVHDAVEAWTGRHWDLGNNLGLAEFLAYLQHNGFPTPLLDWTFSPYIAAYFAYEGINHFNPQSDHVAIYSFNQLLWTQSYAQVYDVAHSAPHVSVLHPRMVGNHKLALQQGCFTWSNIRDIETHIAAHEADHKTYLRKFELPVSERSRVMRELALMGISALQLMPSVESVCKKALEELVTQLPPEARR
jgi:FRG domain-containing protein